MSFGDRVSSAVVVCRPVCRLCSLPVAVPYRFPHSGRFLWAPDECAAPVRAGTPAAAGSGPSPILLTPK